MDNSTAVHYVNHQGANEVPIAVSRDQRPVVMGHGKAHFDISGVSARKKERSGRLPIKGIIRQHRMVTGSSGISEDVRPAKLCDEGDELEADMFASRMNYQIPKFVTLRIRIERREQQMASQYHGQE